MKRIALLTAAAMAFSTAGLATEALAQSARVVVRAPDVNIQWGRDRYTGYDNSHYRKDFRGRWVTLASNYNARTDRQFINLGSRGGYRKIRIEATRGEPVIKKVAIEFADRSVQAVDYDGAMPRGTGEVIDLNGDTRRINRIIVYTDRGSRGAYSVYGA